MMDRNSSQIPGWDPDSERYPETDDMAMKRPIQIYRQQNQIHEILRATWDNSHQKISRTYHIHIHMDHKLPVPTGNKIQNTRISLIHPWILLHVRDHLLLHRVLNDLVDLATCMESYRDGQD